MKTPTEDRFLETKSTLLSRLSNANDQESWRQFFETYWKFIYNTALKMGLRDVEAQDVVQETIISIARRMPDFKRDSKPGTFKIWLLHVTRQHVAEQIRKRPVVCELGSTVTEEASVPATRAEDDLEQDWQSALLEAAIANVKRRVDPRMYQIYDIHVNKQWPAARVAQALKVHPAKVFLAKSRVSKMIEAEVKRLQREVV